MTEVSAGAPGIAAFRASILHFRADPAVAGDAACEFWGDGVLVLRDGIVVGVGDAAAMLGALPESVPVTDYRGKLIMPGFIDLHTHFPQTEIIAAPGQELLDWLRDYAMPAETRFADPGHARDVADFFLAELLRNGTTTAAVFATVHPQSVDAFFSAASVRNLRMIAGKVLMDRHCPENLRDSAESGYTESRALIDRWHGKGRQLYAVTPRFAPTSSEAQLAAAGTLLGETPGLFLQTHLAENHGEMRWVAELFPARQSYLDVYAHYGMLRERAIYAHCIHLSEAERRRFAAAGAVMAFCPTSNLFLGSGLFDWRTSRAVGAHVGFGSDVGGGTSFSLLATAAEGYKVAKLQGQALSPLEAFHALTRGAATALGLQETIGSFTPGAEGDFVVIDLNATPLLRRRMQRVESLAEQLFVLMMLGDDRTIVATHVMGVCQHRRDAAV